MQDCANYSLTQLKDGMVVEKPYTLVDSRDNTQYTIALLKDGNIWMCENLRLGGSSAMALTGNDTDIPKNQNFTLPVSSTSGFDSSHTQCLYIDPTYGGYYSWNVATAGSGGSSGDAPYSILPKGWGLPTQAEYSALWNASGSSDSARSSTLQSAPANFVLFGLYINSSPRYQDSDGYCWSSTAHDNRYAYNLHLDSSGGNPSNSGFFKYNGLNVRGVCKGNGITNPETTEPT